VAGRGPLLQHTLATEPTVVEVELRLGPYRYCLAFGGTAQRFTAGKKLVRKKAARPTSCQGEG
jgi:hypothetical protein